VGLKSFKNQASKLQGNTKKQSSKAERCINTFLFLEIEVSLELGGWDLELHLAF
jgi:hypothetical protein